MSARETFGCRDAIEDGHLDVHDHEIGSKFGRKLNRCLAVCCLPHDIKAVVSQGLDDVEPNERLVFCYDDSSWGGGGGGWFLHCHPINPTVLFSRSLTSRCGGMADAEHS